METIHEGDARYNATRTVFAAIGKPQVIFRPQSTQEIGEAITFATSHKLELSIKSGGHSNSGFSTNDGGVVIDLFHFTRCELDGTIAHIGAGNTWGRVAVILKKHGRAISSGDTKTVGVGGLSTGGGIGWMVRKFGLTIDHLVGAEVVCADGSVHRVDDSHEPDLFWAIRGGGSNFGIVTDFAIETQPVQDVFAGQLIYDTSNTPELLRMWRDSMRSSSDDLTCIVNVLPSFMGNPAMVMIGCCYASDDAHGAERAIAPLRKLGALQKDGIMRKPYSEVLEDAHPPQGMKITVNNRFFEKMDDHLIGTIAEAQKQKPDLVLQLRSLGGAISKRADDATAFAYRSCETLIVSPTFLVEGTSREDESQAMSAWEMIAREGHGMYGNLLSVVGPEITSAMYPPETYHRLAKIKRIYDPDNTFRTNHNILPATG